MKAYSCSSGGVMFVPDAIERGTNKQSKAQSYKDIVGDDAPKKPLREKIFGVFFKENKTREVA